MTEDKTSLLGRLFKLAAEGLAYGLLFAVTVILPMHSALTPDRDGLEQGILFMFLIGPLLVAFTVAIVLLRRWIDPDEWLAVPLVVQLAILAYYLIDGAHYYERSNQYIIYIIATTSIAVLVTIILGVTRKIWRLRLVGLLGVVLLMVAVNGVLSVLQDRHLDQARLSRIDSFKVVDFPVYYFKSQPTPSDVRITLNGDYSNSVEPHILIDGPDGIVFAESKYPGFDPKPNCGIEYGENPATEWECTPLVEQNGYRLYKKKVTYAPEAVDPYGIDYWQCNYRLVWWH